MKLLAAIATIDKEAESHFKAIVSELKSSPSPDARLIAALRLYGAEGMANITLPALISCLEKDPSTPVQLAAATSLGGYKDRKNKVLPLLMRKFRNAEEQHRHVLAWTICELEPESSIINKYLRDCFQAYAQRHNYSPGWLFEFLPAHKEQGVKAIKNLIIAAERAEKKWGNGTNSGYAAFKKISDILVTVGSDDPRVLKFFTKKSSTRSEAIEVYCDSVARRITAIQKQE